MFVMGKNKDGSVTQNDFYVAIQLILEEAKTSGWSLDQVIEYAHDAVDEFEGENNLEEDYDAD